jgi:hypothetical protein
MEEQENDEQQPLTLVGQKMEVANVDSASTNPRRMCDY